MTSMEWYLEDLKGVVGGRGLPVVSDAYRAEPYPALIRCLSSFRLCTVCYIIKTILCTKHYILYAILYTPYGCVCLAPISKPLAEADPIISQPRLCHAAGRCDGDGTRTLQRKPLRLGGLDVILQRGDVRPIEVLHYRPVGMVDIAFGGIQLPLYKYIYIYMCVYMYTYIYIYTYMCYIYTCITIAQT